MARMFNGALMPDASLASSVRAWAGWIESVLTTIGGWTVTSDTGQTAPASLPAATAISQKLGYRIYQMNDAFTAINPIFMRIDFASGTDSSGTLYKPAMWFRIGQATDGAGNITSILWDGLGPTGSNLPTLATNTQPSASGIFVTHSYASADNSRFVIGLWVEPLGQSTVCISLERTRDTNGIYTADGLNLTWTDIQMAGGGGTTQSLAASRHLICGNTSGNPPTEKGCGLIFPQIVGASSRRPVGLTTHIKGLTQQPGMNVVLAARADIMTEGQFMTNVYGLDTTYQTLGALWANRGTAGPTGSSAGINDAGITVGIRYDP